MRQGNSGKRPLPDLIEVGYVPAKPPAAPSNLKAPGKRTWQQLWATGHIWLGPSDEPAVRLACEQADEVSALRRAAAQIKNAGLKLQYHYATQAAEKLLMSSLSQLGFTPTARARFGLTVAQAAETESRLTRFQKKRAG